ncbi:enoyl-CoA hydratase/isomerase family protein [Burkholderia multivorans]|uniref:enoyl-CoA hydratase/isomerase family protein n=1 Tax=Burkholderia multivorans TaxID=87883 RepID=UPI00202A055E|nr:enoyl-CoA hydratase/isomerase family protein [Burkholderia multivorans]
MSGNPVILEKNGAVATITLNSPQKKNALSTSVVDVLSSVIADVEHDGSIRALLLRGEGRMFSCGGDIDEMVAASDTLSTFVDLCRRCIEGGPEHDSSIRQPAVSGSLCRTRCGSRRRSRACFGF